MNVSDIYQWIDDWAPFDSAAKWDNVGLQIGSKEQSVQTVCLSLEVDSGLLDHLKNQRYDLLITHHPVFFRPIKSLDLDLTESKIASVFLKNEMSLISAHTNLDRARDGVNDQLMREFGFDPYQSDTLEDEFGSVIHLETECQTSTLKNQWLAHRWLGKKSSVQRIAFCAGSGKSMIQSCVQKKADLFITGELGYHDEVEAGFQNLDLMILGHKESEQIVLPTIKERLLAKWPRLDVTIR